MSLHQKHNFLYASTNGSKKGGFGRNKKALIPDNQHQTLKVWFRDWTGHTSELEVKKKSQ